MKLFIFKNFFVNIININILLFNGNYLIPVCGVGWGEVIAVHFDFWGLRGEGDGVGAE